MFHITNLSYRYKKSTRDALLNVTFTPEMGKVNAVVGLNGAGKTTLFDIVTSVIAPVKGVYDVPDPNEILYQLQGVPFPSTLRGCDLVRLLLNTDEPGRFNQDIYLSFDSLTNREVENYRRLWKMKFGEMSIGERRWLIITTMCQMQRKLYIFDEPTAGVDPDSRVNILSRIERLCTDTDSIVLMSTHILNELQFINCCIHVLHNGSIIFNGSFQEFLSVYQTDNPDFAFQRAVAGS